MLENQRMIVCTYDSTESWACISENSLANCGDLKKANRFAGILSTADQIQVTCFFEILGDPFYAGVSVLSISFPSLPKETSFFVPRSRHPGDIRTGMILPQGDHLIELSVSDVRVSTRGGDRFTILDIASKYGSKPNREM